MMNIFDTTNIYTGEEGLVDTIKNKWNSFTGNYYKIGERYEQKFKSKDLTNILKNTKISTLPKDIMKKHVMCCIETIAIITSSVEAVLKKNNSSYDTTHNEKLTKDVTESIKNTLNKFGFKSLIHADSISTSSLYNLGYKSSKDIVENLVLARNEIKRVDKILSKLWTPLFGKPLTVLAFMFGPLGTILAGYSLINSEKSSLRDVLEVAISQLEWSQEQLIKMCETIDDKIGNESFLTELLTTNLENTNVRFRPDTDLGHICQDISANISLSIPSGLDEEEQTVKMIESIDNYFETPEGSKHFEAIKQYSEIFSEKINDAFITLKTKVTPEVDVLSKRIEQKATEYVEKITSLNNINRSIQQVEPLFTYVDLSKYQNDTALQYGKELVQKYMDNKVSSLNALSLRYVVDAIPKITNIKVSEDQLKSWATTIASEMTNTPEDSLDSKVILGTMEAIATVFEDSKFSALKDFIFNSDMRSGKFNEVSVQNAMMFIKLENTFSKLDTLVDLPNEEDIIKFKQNLQSIQDFYKTVVVLLSEAYEKYSKCVAIGENLINMTGFNEFQNAGGTAIDIANHIRIFHNQNKDDVIYNQVSHMNIPSSGLSTKALIENMDYVREKINLLTNQVKAQLTSIQNTATKQAYEDVLREYVTDIEFNHPEMIDGDPHQFGINCRRLIPQISHTLVRFENENITDAVYEFYLKTWYSSSLVSNIYYKLGAVLINDINQTDTLNEDTVKYAHLTVMTDILSEYITNTMIIPTK